MSRCQKMQRIINIDGLRAICALAVLFYHYGYLGSLRGNFHLLILGQAFPGIVKYGYIGVNIFFCISGFVIAYSAWGRTPLQFALSRIARLYPTFVFCMTLTFAIRLLWGGQRYATSLEEYFSNLTMLPQIFGHEFMSGVYWSIVIEIIFYGWVFLLMICRVLWNRQLLVIFVWLALSAMREFLIPDGALRILLLTEYAPYFALGMILHEFKRDGRISPPAATLFAAALLLAILAVIRETSILGTTHHTGFSAAAAATVFLTGLALLMGCIFYNKPLASAGFLAWCGGISYPLYLLHQETGFIAFTQLQGPDSGGVLLVLVGSVQILLASAIWFGFDRNAVPATRAFLARFTTKLKLA